MSTPERVAVDFLKLAAEATLRVHGVVVAHGQLLQSAVKRNASEPRTNPRPSSSPEGPRAMTGDYRGSIGRQTTRRATTSTAVVGTNKVQGRRLELGFHGVDSAGRRYEQRPYPHFGPALDEIRPGFEAAIHAAGLPKDRER